ncbi:MAG: transglycosylase SLT domain-containing protein [Candidatus Manganitrophus sp.]|nr:transglycosylase SLT domain-containing protein [Candidatus Manganitrophus sp.]
MILRVLLLILILIPAPAFSMEVFQYVDESGTIHFTNVPTDPRYRRLQGNQKKSSYVGKDHRQKILGYVEKEAAEQGMEPALIKAVIRAESDFNTFAVSSAGALGLMQLMPATAADLRLSDPFDPEENIRGGIRYLRYLLGTFNNDLVLTLAAYHAGLGNVLKHGRIPPIEETQVYVERVLRFYKQYLGKKAKGMPVFKGTRSTGDIVYTNRPEQYSNLPLKQFSE